MRASSPTGKRPSAENRLVSVTTRCRRAVLPEEHEHGAIAQARAARGPSIWKCSIGRTSATSSGGKRFAGSAQARQETGTGVSSSTPSRRSTTKQQTTRSKRGLRPGAAAHRPRRGRTGCRSRRAGKARDYRQAAVIRQIGYVAMVSVDGKADDAWKLAGKSTRGRCKTFVTAMPLISDPGLRAGLYDQHRAAAGRAAGESGGGECRQGHARPLCADRAAAARGTLTLAEVEVYERRPQRRSQRQGDAEEHGSRRRRQPRRSTATRVRSYGGGGQTHTAGEHRRARGGKSIWARRLPIDQIVIYNRADGDLGQRLQGLHAARCSTPAATKSSRKDDNPATEPTMRRSKLGGGGPAALVRRAAMNALAQVRGQEAKTFALLAQVRDRRRRSAGGDSGDPADARSRLGRRMQAPPLLDVVVGVHQEDRRSPTALRRRRSMPWNSPMRSRRCCRPMRPSMPRASWRELGVRVIRIGTLLEQMSYDKDVIVVQAGKPVEFLFENTDLMPHNFVIAQPGSLEEIGLARRSDAPSSRSSPAAAIRAAVEQGAAGQHAAAAARDAEAAASPRRREPGVYPYVCTYPGHWRRMYGALYVVADLDAYLAEPGGVSRRRNPLPIKDALLKDRRPRTEWKLEDLAAGRVELSQTAARTPPASRCSRWRAASPATSWTASATQFGPDLAQARSRSCSRSTSSRKCSIRRPRSTRSFRRQVFQLDSGADRHGPGPRRDADGRSS